MTDPHRPRNTPGDGAPGAAPRSPERRKDMPGQDHAALLAGLTPQQRATIETMESFHWYLKFVRRPLFKSAIPVLFDRDGGRYVVVREDGTIDEDPGLTLRDGREAAAPHLAHRVALRTFAVREWRMSGLCGSSMAAEPERGMAASDPKRTSTQTELLERSDPHCPKGRSWERGFSSLRKRRLPEQPGHN